MHVRPLIVSPIDLMRFCFPGNSLQRVQAVRRRWQRKFEARSMDRERQRQINVITPWLPTSPVFKAFKLQHRETNRLCRAARVSRVCDLRRKRDSHVRYVRSNMERQRSESSAA